MKPIILPRIGLIGLMNGATDQEIIRFTFIGNAGGNHESVVVTTANDFKMKGVQCKLMGEKRYLFYYESWVWY
jgi:hypothetical protein